MHSANDFLHNPEDNGNVFDKQVFFVLSLQGSAKAFNVVA